MQRAVFLTACRPSATVADGRGFQASWRSVSRTLVRSFGWWFAIGALLTLSVLMVQGGVRDLLDGAPPGSGASRIPLVWHHNFRRRIIGRLLGIGDESTPVDTETVDRHVDALFEM